MVEQNLLENEELLRALANCEKVADVRETFEKFNIKLGEDATDEAIQKTLDNRGSELSEDELINVPGGILVSSAIAATAAAGAAWSVGGFICHYAWQKYQNARKYKE